MEILKYGFFFLFDRAGKPRVTHCVGFSDKREDDLFVSTAICGSCEEPDVSHGLAIAKKRIDRMAKTGRLPRGNEIVCLEALDALLMCGKTLSGKTSKEYNETSWPQNKCYRNLDRNYIKNGEWPQEFKLLIGLVDALPSRHHLRKFIVNVSNPAISDRGKVAMADDFNGLVDMVSAHLEKKSIKFKKIEVNAGENVKLMDDRLSSIEKRIDALSKKLKTATAEF